MNHPLTDRSRREIARISSEVRFPHSPSRLLMPLRSVRNCNRLERSVVINRASLAGPHSGPAGNAVAAEDEELNYALTTRDKELYYAGITRCMDQQTIGMQPLRCRQLRYDGGGEARPHATHQQEVMGGGMREAFYVPQSIITITDFKWRLSYGRGGIWEESSYQQT